MSKIYSPDYQLRLDWANMWEKGVREAWANDMMIKYGSIRQAWDNYAEKYEEDEIKYSNRAELVNKIVESKPDSVLDIGGGTGVFAIPLARLAKRVVVLEPSKGMCDTLREKAEKEQLDNITVIQQKWEDAIEGELIKENNGNLFDVVLSSHSLYYITNLHHSFLKMNNVAKGYVYLLIGYSGQDHDSHYEKLHLLLHKTHLPSYPDYSFLYMILREVGIEPNIEMIDAKIKMPIKDTEEMVGKWKEYLGLEELSHQQKEALRDYLSQKTREIAGQSYYCDERKNALIYWRVKGSGA
ncbi:class I SAM-dependent methyltransferase [Dehalococcoidia bacterium]|nr:class I SAM-dependent methyltransferase [Dehalococcoidia bacterium]